MSSEGAAGADRRGEPRVPFEGSVRLRYRLFHEFLEENAANISSGGMFIRTIHPGEPGSELEFEIRLDDDFTLIRGRGRVAWVRRAGDVPGADPGMGIRFLALPEESRALVDKIVDERVAAGLELFDLERHAPAKPPRAVAAPRADDAPIWELDGAAAAPRAPEADPAVAPLAPAAAPEAVNPAALDPELPPSPREPPPPPPVARAAAPRAVAAGRSSPVRLIAVALLSAAIGAGAVVTFYWLYVQPSIEALETRIDELSGSPGGPWQPPAGEPPAAPGAGAATPAEPPDVGGPAEASEVVDALRGWAAAWSEQRVDDYLAYYAAEFVPPGGLDRAAWEESRRARIARPEWIRVALTLVQVEPRGSAAAEVSFVQSYRSERYRDLVRKRLRMVLEEGGWKIAAERAAPR